MAQHDLRNAVFSVKADGSDYADTDHVKVLGSFSATSTITATNVGVAVPCTVVRIIVDDVGTNGTVQINDAGSASGAQYGPHKLIAGQVMEYGIHFAVGAYVTLTGSAKVTLVYKADS